MTASSQGASCPREGTESYLAVTYHTRFFFLPVNADARRFIERRSPCLEYYHLAQIPNN
jgi:hypothetical protein